MKIFFLIVCILSLCSACSTTFIGKKYIYINADKEWEIELEMKKDSTFILQDVYGCVRFSQKGKWYLMKTNKDRALILSDTTIVEEFNKPSGRTVIHYTSNLDGKNYSIDKSFYFPLISNDTIWFEGRNKFILRNLVFEKSDGENIENKRVVIKEKELIDIMGREEYINAFGNGDIKVAREKIKRCH